MDKLAGGEEGHPGIGGKFFFLLGALMGNFSLFFGSRGVASFLASILKRFFEILRGFGRPKRLPNRIFEWFWGGIFRGVVSMPFLL